MIVNEKGHTMHHVFIYLLLGLFAVMATLLILFAAKLYRTTVQAGEEHNAIRLAHAFIVNTVHAMDESDAVSVEKGEASDTLVIREDVDGESYYRLLYCENGTLRDLYTDNMEKRLSAQMGEAVCEMQAMRLTLHEDGLLTVSFTNTDGTQRSACVALKTDR